jgi:hypothetical protein
MAKRAANKKTNAERQAELAVKFQAGELPDPIMGIQSGEERADLPEGVTAVLLEPTPEGIEIMHRAIAENVGEAGPNNQVTEFEDQTENEEEGDPSDDEIEPEKERNSVVKDKFKVKYIENARAGGYGGKAAKRSNWDWLAQQIAGYCLNENHSIRMSDFTALLDANGVDHSRWTNRNRGWEGRFRMTGRVALQKVVANNEMLKLPEGISTPAPSEWCERFKTKA